MRKTNQRRELKLLILGTSLFLAILFFLIAFGYKNFTRKSETFVWVEHTLTVIHDLQELETLLQETSSNIRGFVLTEQEHYQLRLTELSKDLKKSIARVQTDSKENATQKERIELLVEVAEDLRSYSDLVRSLVSLGKGDELLEMVRRGEGRLIIDRGTKILHEMKAHERKLLDQRLKEYNDTEASSASIILSVSLLAFIFLLTGSHFIHRQLLRRLKVEADLSKISQIQRTLIESAAMALIAVDRDGRINLFNPAAEILLGYFEDEVLGKQPSFFHDPTEVAQMAAMLSRELGETVAIGMDVFTIRASKGIVETDQWTYIRKDGSRLPVKLTVSALRDESGEITGYLGIAYDITKQLEFEDALVEAKDAALVANKAKSEFLANMSHEIRTPMNAILGMAELLRETELNEDQRKYVEIFSRAGESLLGIINDILDLSKIEAGHFQLDKGSFSLNAVIEKASELMALRAHQKKLELVVDVNEHLPDHVIGDGNRLRQVIINLLGNAVKFTRRGEILLSVKPGERFNELVEIIIEVQDTGIGMTPEQVSKLFDRFAQADSSITKEFGGTGLGLSISKRLVELMDGKIEVQSTFGIGTRFIVTVVLGQDQATYDEPEEMELKGDRVLVVDDSRTNRMILRKMLEGRDAIVTEAEDGERAIELVREYTEKGIPFNLILMDCRMPGMDGLDVAAMIKKEPSMDGPLLLMLTSDNRPGDMAKSRSLGFKSHLLKPVLKRELFSAIQRSIMEKTEPQSLPKVDEKKESLPERLTILLADDNDENRMVIVSFLKSYKWTIDEARNGREALLLYQQKKYDLILMDMQMPVMDGYSATVEIRKIQRDRNEVRTPIIALTAYALKEEMHKSMVAGCDDHVTKPVSKVTLLETVDRFTREYTFKIDPDLNELIPDYLEKRRSEVREFHRLLEQMDFPSIQKLGHKLRGSAGSYGFPILSEAGKEFEDGAKEKDFQRVKRALTLYETVMSRIKVKYT